LDSRLKETWESCVKCGICRSVCPVFKEEKSEPYVARGHITLLSELVSGNVDFSEYEAKDYLYKCLLCTTCVEACPNNSETDTIVEIARHEVIKHHGLPLYKKIMAILLKDRALMDFAFRNATLFSSFLFKRNDDSSRASLKTKFETPIMEKGRLIPKLTKKTFLQKYKDYSDNYGYLSLFPGCLINYTYTEIGDAFVNILKKLDISFRVPQKQLCCGAPVYFAGNFEDAAILARKNIDLFSRVNSRYIIVMEPTCASMIKNDYPKLFMYLEDKEYEKKARDLAKKVLDPVKFLYDNTDILDRLKHLDMKTTYHDPCHLKRAQNIKDEPRAFIKKASNFTEMKEADRCCGNGGTFSIDYRETSLKIASRKVEHIENSKADYLVTGCSACIMQLSEILHRHEDDHIKTIHTLELIDMALDGGNNEG